MTAESHDKSLAQSYFQVLLRF